VGTKEKRGRRRQCSRCCLFRPGHHARGLQPLVSSTRRPATMRRHGYTPPRVQLSIISDDEPPPPPYEDAPPSEPSEPPMKRFLKWPYYRAPDGWVVHPAWNPSVRPLNWTAFVPSASPKGRTRPAPPSPSLSGMPLVQKLQYAQPSPFFARVPAQGVSDPNFVAYRQAQATAGTSTLPTLRTAD
jgi:hypothetical protein